MLFEHETEQEQELLTNGIPTDSNPFHQTNIAKINATNKMKNIFGQDTLCIESFANKYLSYYCHLYDLSWINTMQYTGCLIINRTHICMMLRTSRARLQWSADRRRRWVSPGWRLTAVSGHRSDCSRSEWRPRRTRRPAPAPGPPSHRSATPGALSLHTEHTSEIRNNTRL